MTSRTEYGTQTPNKPSIFDVQYLRNHRTLDIGVLGYDLRNTLPKLGPFLLYIDITYGQRRGVYSVLVAKPEGKRTTWETHNIKMGFQEVGWGCMVWIDLAQDRGG